jgi:hypothetical protein
MIQATLSAADVIVEGTIPDSISQAQCQGMPLALEFSYPSGGKDPLADVEDFISIAEGIVSVDTTITNDGKASLQPGYRPIYAKTKNTYSLLDTDSVSYHSMPIMVYPKDMLSTTKTA